VAIAVVAAALHDAVDVDELIIVSRSVIAEEM
jgi:hypothetical protein